MDRKRTEDFRRWLTAEATGDETRAEASFEALFASWPRLAPRPGFAERVVWAVRPAAAASPLAAWGWKLVLVASLALAGAATALWPLARLLPLRGPRLTSIIEAGPNALSWVAARVTDGVATWDLLARVGEAVATASTTPEAAAALAASAALGSIGLYVLHHLLTLERRMVG